MKFVMDPSQKWEALAAESSFRPGKLALRCGVSLRTLQRHFKKHYGKKLSAWMRGVRLNRAYQLLKEGQRLKQVAFDLGYKQMSHFSRDFKGFFGDPPKAYLQLRGGMPEVLMGSELMISEVERKPSEREAAFSC